MKLIRATFIGQDILGYKHGETYILWIESLSWYSGSDIRIHRLDNEGWCPYRNILTFLENWTDIQNQEQQGDHPMRIGETFNERAAYHRHGELSPGEHAMARMIREHLHRNEK